MGKPKKLLIEKILTASGTQSRRQIDPQVVQEYAEDMTAGDAFPPVTVISDGILNWLVDGFHRLAAARQLGRTTIEATVKKGNHGTAVWASLGANREHGLRRTRGDKQRAVQLALEEFTEKSDRALAKQIGVSYPFVAKIRSELVAAGHIRHTSERIGSDGRSYQLPTGNVTSQNPPPDVNLDKKDDLAPPDPPSVDLMTSP